MHWKLGSLSETIEAIYKFPKFGWSSLDPVFEMAFKLLNP